MIRKPISGTVRFALGCASILCLVLLYNWFSNSRQKAARQEAKSVAIEQLEKLQEQLVALDALAQEPEAATEAEADELDSRRPSTQMSIAKFEQVRDDPQNLLYNWFANSRQEAAWEEAEGVASEQMEESQKQLDALNESAAEAKKEELASRRARTQKRIAKFEQMRDDPQKRNLTIPSWSMLWNDGFLRAITPQGSFKKKETWLLIDFAATGKRLLTALALGCFLSIVVGLAMGCYEPVDALLMPPFAFFSKVPATAVLPIFFVLIQINFSMYVVIIVFGMLPSLAQAISSSVKKDVPEELVFKAYTLGASQIELIWNVIFRQVLPRIIDAFRLQIGPALILLVAAEWMVSGEGIGYRLRLFYQRTDMTVVYVYIFLLGVLGLMVDYGLIWLRRRFCPWFGD